MYTKPVSLHTTVWLSYFTAQNDAGIMCKTLASTMQRALSIDVKYDSKYMRTVRETRC